MKPKNNYLEFQKASEFRDAAIADGWIAKPTHAAHEPLESAATLTHPDGFTMMILTRNNDLKRYPNVKKLFEINISIWGSDGLHIDTPLVYDMKTIRDGMKKCSNCSKIVEQTFRYSFAGRCCKDCLPIMQAKYEKPGWRD